MTDGRSIGFSRREVLQVFGAAAGAAAIGALTARGQGPAGPAAAGGPGPVVRFARDADDAVANAAPVTWAISQLEETLRAAGIRITDDAAAPAFTIFIGGMANDRLVKNAKLDAAKLSKTPESLVITGGGPGGSSAITVLGADPRGVVYGLTELADSVRYSPSPGSVLPRIGDAAESPANKVRGICRVFVSEMEDKPWYYDQAGWEKYLDMLVTNRFNRFNLSLGLGYDFSTRVPDAYFFFAYPFFLDMPGYKVHAIDKAGQPLAAAERDKNLSTLQFISDECDKRGIHFQLGIWTHSIQWPAAIANYTIAGISSEIQPTYSRDALHALLAACPNIKGITIRTHGESGVPEGNFDFWRTIFTGTQGLTDKTGGRREVEIDLHAKGITQEIIDGALATGNPVTISPKFWAEHMGLPYIQASIRENEMPRERDGSGLMAISTGTRNFLRYGYGDLLKTDRKYRVIHRVFPGTQKLLLWGDPLFAAEYGKNFSFSGTDGVEYMEPLAFKGREGSSWEVNRGCYADAALRASGGEADWEKYAYTYRLLGRLAFNPGADADVWRRLLAKDYGDAAGPVEKALASTSRLLPLITVAHMPSAAHANYWPELYLNMSIVDPRDPGPYGGDTPSPKDFVHVSPLDPQIFASIDECAASLVNRTPLGKISPVAVAAQLDAWAQDAIQALADADQAAGDSRTSKAHRRMALDTTIAIGLGRFFASKFRAGIYFAIFNRTGHEPARSAAVMAYRRARDLWADFVDHTAGVYVGDISFGEDPQLRGDWKKRLPAIDADLAAMQTRPAQNPGTDALHAQAAIAMDEVAQAPAALVIDARHTPPARFTPGQPLPIQITLSGAPPGSAATLWFRHLNQGEQYHSAEMAEKAGQFSAQIPAEYSQSQYPLQYYMAIRSPAASGRGGEALYPGFREGFLGQPYFVVQQA